MDIFYGVSAVNVLSKIKFLFMKFILEIHNCLQNVSKFNWSKSYTY